MTYVRPQHGDPANDGSSTDATVIVAALSTGLEAVESGKAPLVSPALTGVPTVPTAAALTNSTQAASTAYTDAAVGVGVAAAESYADRYAGSPAGTAGRPLSATDASVSNARTPSGAAGGDLTGTYPSPSVGTVLGGSKPLITAAQTLSSGEKSQVQANLTVPPASRQVLAGTGLTGGGDLTADRTLTVAYGTTSTSAAVGNDARFAGSAAGTAGAALSATDASTTNARTPTAHATTHESGGSDPIRLDQLAAPTAAVGLNSQKVTGLANGSAGSDAAAFGQIPTSLPPSGAAGGDLTGTYPSPSVGTVLGGSKPLITAAQTLSSGEKTQVQTNLAVPPAARQVLAGTGLTGGGDLTADRTLTVAYGTGAGTAAQGNDARFAGSAAGTAGAALSATDASVTNARTPTGAAGGSLTGTYPNPSVPVVTATTAGLVPAPPNNTTTFLRGDGTFAAPPGGADAPGVVNLGISTDGTEPLPSAGTGQDGDWSAGAMTAAYAGLRGFAKLARRSGGTWSTAVAGGTMAIPHVDQSLNVARPAGWRSPLFTGSLSSTGWTFKNLAYSGGYVPGSTAAASISQAITPQITSENALFVYGSAKIIALPTEATGVIQLGVGAPVTVGAGILASVDNAGTLRLVRFSSGATISTVTAAGVVTAGASVVFERFGGRYTAYVVNAGVRVANSTVEAIDPGPTSLSVSQFSVDSFLGGAAVCACWANTTTGTMTNILWAG